MSDSQMWFTRLEIVAIAEVCLSMFACLTAPEQSYNVSMGFFTLYSATMRSGSLNFKCMGFHGLALLFDIILLVLKGSTWDHAGGVIASLTLAVVIVNLFVKCLALVVMVLIHSELGGGHLNYFPTATSMMGDQGYRSGYSVISSSSHQSQFPQPFPSFHHNSHLSKQSNRSSSFGNLSANHASARSLEDEEQQQQQQLLSSNRPASTTSSSSTPTSASSLPIATAASSYQN